MSDIVDQKKRSRMMANIKGKNTKPEMAIRSALHRIGYRFRLHRKDLPGKPDIVLPKHRAVVFVNGCFWHGHFCHLFRWPKTREEFWREKILSNKERDQRNVSTLIQREWRICIIWECSIRKQSEENLAGVIGELVEWIESSEPTKEISR